MMIGNAEYQCSCVRYMTQDNIAVLIVSLTVAFALLLVIFIIIGVVLYHRRRCKLAEKEQVPDDGNDSYTSQERQYSRQLPDDYIKDATSMELREQHMRQLFHHYCLRNIAVLMLENHFSQRIINMWNNMPSDIVDFSTICSFKRTVKVVDLSPFLKCCSLGHVLYCFTLCLSVCVCMNSC